MLDRITSDARILGGKPIVRGTRISVEMILEWVASGATREDIVHRHPHLCEADVQQALTYAASAMGNQIVLSDEVAGVKLVDYPLLTDENIDPAVIAHLRQRGFDVLDVMESGRQGDGDLDLLRCAVAEGRVVVTHDSDFGTLAIRLNQPLVGVIYLRPGHIDPSFTIATIESILRLDTDLRPPFVLVAKRTGNRVRMRIRRMDST